jgi:spore coat polysaccharide biosynthesis protein SpsF
VQINPKIVAVIQARMGSTRLPGKILKTIEGKPMLWHIVDRLKRVEKVDDVVIATSNNSKDDQVFQMADEYSISCFRGSETDVLRRFYDAAVEAEAKYIIRITGDCPLVDPKIIGELINLYFDKHLDFCGVATGAGVANQSNINRFPDGLDAEMFSFKVLKEADNEAYADFQREHVTPFIWKNKERYKSATLYSSTGDYSNLRWTVDNQEDYDFAKWIYSMLYHENNEFNYLDVLNLLKKYPEAASNNHLIGKEGYEEFWE